MKSDENKYIGCGLSFSNALFLVLLTLKLTGVIDWSWWWVLAPIWGSVLLMIIVLIAIILIYKFSNN